MSKPRTLTACIDAPTCSKSFASMKGGLVVGASQEKLLQQPETVEAVE